MPGGSISVTRKRLRVSQSLLASFQRCPEQARLELVNPVRKRNDALACGTAMHLYAQARLEGKPKHHAYTLAEEWLGEESMRDDFRFVKVAKPETMFAHFDACVRGWENHVLRQLPSDGLVETTLSAPLIEDDDGWQVILEGTPDYVVERTVWDWKSAASEYNAYETAQWAIQPTSYTFLATYNMQPTIDFTYAVMVKPHGYVQMIDVERGPNDWAWLARIAQGLLHMARTMLHEPWPVVHTHYLCDPKWCPYWDGCRGAYVAGEHPIAITNKGALHATR